MPINGHRSLLPLLFYIFFAFSQNLVWSELFTWPNAHFWRVCTLSSPDFFFLNVSWTLLLAMGLLRSTSENSLGSRYNPPYPHCVAATLSSLSSWDKSYQPERGIHSLHTGSGVQGPQLCQVAPQVPIQWNVCCVSWWKHFSWEPRPKASRTQSCRERRQKFCKWILWCNSERNYSHFHLVFLDLYILLIEETLLYLSS